MTGVEVWRFPRAPFAGRRRSEGCFSGGWVFRMNAGAATQACSSTAVGRQRRYIFFPVSAVPTTLPLAPLGRTRDSADPPSPCVPRDVTHLILPSVPCAPPLVRLRIWTNGVFSRASSPCFRVDHWPITEETVAAGVGRAVRASSDG